MNKILTFCLLSIALSCTATSKETPAEVYDASFTCPAGWTVSEQEDYGDSKYLSIEKSGLNSSGLIMVTYSDEHIELTDYLDIYRESFSNQTLLSNIQFEKEKEATYGQHKGLVCEYTFSIMSVEHEGRLYVFHSNGKSVCVTEQEAIEDKAENKAGFEKVKETLTIK